MRLVKLPCTKDLHINPDHVVYVEQKPPYLNGDNAMQPRVEVCITMYGSYRTEDIFNTTAADVAAIIKGESHEA